jgi:hypothetical protein
MSLPSLRTDDLRAADPQWGVAEGVEQEKPISSLFLPSGMKIFKGTALRVGSTVTCVKVAFGRQSLREDGGVSAQLDMEIGDAGHPYLTNLLAIHQMLHGDEDPIPEDGMIR